MNREIKFRGWNIKQKLMEYDDGETTCGAEFIVYIGTYIPMQYTGLKDKNGVAEVYEGDIIDEYGNIKGNKYEMDKGANDFVIEGLGTSAWAEAEKKGLERGLKYAQ